MTVEVSSGVLPVWESRLYYGVFIFFAVYSVFTTYQVSHGILAPHTVKYLVESPLVSQIRKAVPPARYSNGVFSNFWYMSGATMDMADAEWTTIRPMLPTLIACFAIHSIGLAMSDRVFGDAVVGRIVNIILGLSGIAFLLGPACFSVCGLFCMCMTSCLLIHRQQLLFWPPFLLFLAYSQQFLPLSESFPLAFLQLTICCYTAVKVLNFCLYMCSNPQLSYKEIWFSHLEYLAYLPYSVILIVLFDEFLVQRAKRLGNRQTKSTLWFAVRLCFWFFAFEGGLHILYANAAYDLSPLILEQLNAFQCMSTTAMNLLLKFSHAPIPVASVSFVAGHFFHLKYFVLFGIPSFFARIEGMTPADPPICPSCVTRYSQMWRYFDNGLYQFLKRHIYLPIMRPQLSFYQSIGRSTLSLIAVFGMVLVWHGKQEKYINWVILSSLSLVIERIGDKLLNTETSHTRRNTIKTGSARRVEAALLTATFIPGLFGIFFFLGAEGVGQIISRKVLIDGWKNMIHLDLNKSSSSALIAYLIMVYCMNHVNMDRFKKIKIT